MELPSSQFITRCCVVSLLSVLLEKPVAAVPADNFLAQFLGLENAEGDMQDASQENEVPIPLQSTSPPDAPVVTAQDVNQDDDAVDKDEAHLYYGAAISCRLRIYPYALNPIECTEVLIEDYDPDFLYDNPHRNRTGGRCFWDANLGISQQSGCMCPRPKNDCQKSKECYWHELPGARIAEESDGGSDGYCIHNSERFYNLLARLLAKRGKKDLSLKIKYSSAPAKGKLPYGPHGPATIGFGRDYERLYRHQEPYGGLPYQASPNGYDLSSGYAVGYSQHGGVPFGPHQSGVLACQCPPQPGHFVPLQYAK